MTAADLPQHEQLSRFRDNLSTLVKREWDAEVKCVDAGNVFVHLFLQTKTRYVLTNKKLQYLLIIAQMSQLAQGKILFDDDIKNVKSGFVLDGIADAFATSSAIVSGTSQNMPLADDGSEFVLPYTNRKIFRISKLPTEQERKLLIKVFLTFGAYSEDVLGKYLNSLQQLRAVPSFQVVPKEKIRKSLLGKISREAGAENVLLGFIKTEYLENRKSAAKQKKSVEPVVVSAVSEKPALASEEVPAVAPANPGSQVAAAEQATTENEAVPQMQEVPENTVVSTEQEGAEEPSAAVFTESEDVPVTEAERSSVEDLETAEGIISVASPEVVVAQVPENEHVGTDSADALEAGLDSEEQLFDDADVVESEGTEPEKIELKCAEDFRGKETVEQHVEEQSIDVSAVDADESEAAVGLVPGVAGCNDVASDQVEPEVTTEATEPHEETATEVVPEHPAKVVMAGALAGLVSTPRVVVGKKYTVFVEVPRRHKACEIVVEAPGLNVRVPGILNRISKSLYSYTFVGVAGDIQISAKVS